MQTKVLKPRVYEKVKEEREVAFLKRKGIGALMADVEKHLKDPAYKKALDKFIHDSTH